MWDADIEKCFDRIDRAAWLKKLPVPRPVMRLIREGLEAGVLDGDELLFPKAGTPQGGVLSPLLANIALHGLEIAVVNVSRKHRVVIIRYADDLVILCEDLATLKEALACAEAWLAEMGLKIKASKTRITHTVDEYEGQVGFDFLGFHTLREQYRVGKYRSHQRHAGDKPLIKPSPKAIRRHADQIRDIVQRHRGAPPAALTPALAAQVQVSPNSTPSSGAGR